MRGYALSRHSYMSQPTDPCSFVGTSRMGIPAVLVLPNQSHTPPCWLWLGRQVSGGRALPGLVHAHWPRQGMLNCSADAVGYCSAAVHNRIVHNFWGFSAVEGGEPCYPCIAVSYAHPVGNRSFRAQTASCDELHMSSIYAAGTCRILWSI